MDCLLDVLSEKLYRRLGRRVCSYWVPHYSIVGYAMSVRTWEYLDKWRQNTRTGAAVSLAQELLKCLVVQTGLEPVAPTWQHTCLRSIVRGTGLWQGAHLLVLFACDLDRFVRSRSFSYYL